MDQGRTLEAEELSRAMEDSRASISETVSELREAVNHAVDWREHVKTHPGASLGIAAGAGLIVGRWVGTKITGSGAPGSDVRDDARGWTRPSDPTSVAAAQGGILDASRHRVASRAESLVNRVIDEVADVVEAGALVPLFARLRDFLHDSAAPARRSSEGQRDEARPGRAPAAVDWRGGPPGAAGVQPGTRAGWAANPAAGGRPSAP